MFQLTSKRSLTNYVSSDYKQEKEEIKLADGYASFLYILHSMMVIIVPLMLFSGFVLCMCVEMFLFTIFDTYK